MRDFSGKIEYDRKIKLPPVLLRFNTDRQADDDDDVTKVSDHITTKKCNKFLVAAKRREQTGFYLHFHTKTKVSDRTRSHIDVAHSHNVLF